MQTLIQIIHVVVCIFMILVILLQAGKSGGMGGLGGGGGSGSVFGGRGSQTFLGKVTAACAAIFMVTSLSLAFLSSRSGSVVTERKIEQKKAADAATKPPATNSDTMGSTAGAHAPPPPPPTPKTLTPDPTVPTKAAEQK